MKNKKFLNVEESKLLLSGLGKEFALVQNPEYIYSPFELYPLAQKNFDKLNEVKAIVMDMDGTTTTTETLCIHSLEFMIRKMSGLETDKLWNGIEESDLPNVIGNSTTKHVEYLIKKYKHILRSDKIKHSFIIAHEWTIKYSKDERRIQETIDTKKSFKSIPNDLVEFDESTLVRIGIDIYYQRYHELLLRISDGQSSQVGKELFNNPTKSLIEPMPGVLIILLLVKNLLDNELIEAMDINSGEKIKLVTLSEFFKNKPAKTAIVTSSIFYEADIVMKEIMKLLQNEILLLNISDAKNTKLYDIFSDYNNVYDAFVTASDSSEIRLKPHRDLYSIALHKLNISKTGIDKVIGFEDSESGTIAIRAAGIGKCIAVPFAETSGHNLDAATYVCNGGLPEVIFDHNLFCNTFDEK